jgi:hypothetical protein
MASAAMVLVPIGAGPKIARVPFVPRETNPPHVPVLTPCAVSASDRCARYASGRRPGEAGTIIPLPDRSEVKTISQSIPAGFL